MPEEYVCLDVNGNPITTFVFNDDGTVNGVLTQNSGVYEDPSSSFGGNVYSGTSRFTLLSRECCEKLNFTYEPTTRKCYYKTPCADTTNPSNEETAQAIAQIEAEIKVIEDKLDSISLDDRDYGALNNQLNILNEQLSYYQSQLKPNNIKLIFGIEGDSPVLFEVENPDLDPNQQATCEQQIADLTELINDTTDKLNNYTSGLTSTLIRINNITQALADLSSEETSANASQIEEYKQQLITYNNQVTLLESEIERLTEYLAELQTQLDEIVAECTTPIPPCNLNIEFDYLWNFDCEELLNCAVGDDSMLNYLTIEYNKCRKILLSIQQQISSINSQISDIADAIANNQQELTNLEAQLEIETDPVQIFLIQSEISNITAILASDTQTYLDLQSQLNDLQNSLALQQAICTQIQTQIDNLSTYGNLIDVLQGITFYLTIEKRYLDTTTNQYQWETVYREEFFNIDNLLEHITNNTQTGIYLSGENCDELIENIGVQLGENCDAISASTFYSQWLHQSTIIDASTTYNSNNVLSEIANEYISFGIEIEYDNANCEYCLLMDKIEMNQSCEVIDKTEVVVNRCPSFEMRRVVDNKKSWVNITTGHTRNFDLTDRDTYYKTISHKAVVNSKEIDLEVSAAHAIELDVFSYSDTYPCILSGTTGQTNYYSLMSTDLDDINTTDEFVYAINTELIDSKSRKVISGYPVLRAIYERYLSPSNYGCTGTTSNGYTYCDLIQFGNLLGTYWIDLIEQVIPSTTIWDSVYRYGNTVFDAHKFKYKKYSTRYCTSNTNPCTFSSGQTSQVNVVIEDLSKQVGNEYPDCFIANNIESTCDYLQTWDYSDSCEYQGNVVIINTNSDGDIGNEGSDTDNSVSGDGIVAQEDVDYYNR